MTRDARTKPESNMARPQPANNARASDEIPQGEFIDVLSNQPVDPSRLQVFPVPQEFLSKVLANSPPYLNPEDLKDTAPRGLPVNHRRLAPDEEPEFESTPVTFGSQLKTTAAQSRANATGTVIAPSEEAITTAAIQRSGSAGLLARWAITGKVPHSIKVVLGAAIGLMLLILAWAHLNKGTPETEPKRESLPTASASVPLIPPPSSTVTKVTPSQQSEVASTRTPSDRSASAPVPRRLAPPTLAIPASAKSSSGNPPSPQRASSAAAPESGDPAPKKKAWFSED
jgi:hypothetical protein